MQSFLLRTAEKFRVQADALDGLHDSAADEKAYFDGQGEATPATFASILMLYMPLKSEATPTQL